MLSLQRTVLGAIANVVLNIWLIPTYGAVGAAIATVISYAIAAFFADFLQKETRKIFLMKLRSINVPSALARLV
jgi:PST family polysaccharide transporter